MSCTYHLPTFSANHLLLSFQPDLSPDQPANLPSPGRGGKYEAKLIVGQGRSHAVWKRIEGEMERYRDKTRNEETLRQSPPTVGDSLLMSSCLYCQLAYPAEMIENLLYRALAQLMHRHLAHGLVGSAGIPPHPLLFFYDTHKLGDELIHLLAIALPHQPTEERLHLLWPPLGFRQEKI